MSIFGLPLIIFNVGEDDDELTKILLQASFDGRLKFNEGQVTAAGTLCSLTAASGKDLYLTAAKISQFSNTGSVVDGETELQVNGTAVETAKTSVNDTGTTSINYEFVNLFHKVTATQVLRLEVTGLQATGVIEGTIQAIEVPTGENPATYTGP